MKKIFAPLIIALLAIPAISYGTDFTDTDQVYGWNGAAQIWQTWAAHKTQLGLLFYTETEIDALLADKANKINIAFNAATYADLTITGAEQTAGAFETGVVYVITAVGTTDFTTIGASANTIGVEFTASGAGSGTGTATPLRPIISDTTPTADKQKIAPTYEQMDEALAPKATAIAVEVNGSADDTLTAAEVSSTIVYNTGQAAADIALTLPTAAAGYTALFNVGTAQSNKWGVRAGSSDKIYLLAADGTVAAGSDNGYARMTVAQIGQSFACWTFKTDAYDWMCKAVAVGTSTFAAN